MHTGVHNQNNQARLWTAGINMPKWNTHAKPPQKRLQEQHLATPGYKLYREVSMPAAHTAVLWSPPPTLHSTSCFFGAPALVRLCRRNLLSGHPLRGFFDLGFGRRSVKSLTAFSATVQSTARRSSRSQPLPRQKKV